MLQVFRAFLTLISRILLGHSSTQWTTMKGSVISSVRYSICRTKERRRTRERGCELELVVYVGGYDRISWCSVRSVIHSLVQFGICVDILYTSLLIQCTLIYNSIRFNEIVFAGRNSFHSFRFIVFWLLRNFALTSTEQRNYSQILYHENP